MTVLNPEAIPDIADVRETLLDRLERYRLVILGGLAIAVFGTLGIVAALSIRRDRIDALRASMYAIVFPQGEEQRPLIQQDLRADPEVAREQIAALESLLETARGTEVEPAILFHLMQRHQLAGNDDRVLALGAELRENHAASPVLRIRAAESETTSLVAQMESFSRTRRDFAAAHRVERPSPDKTRVARVETSDGEMKIVFFAAEAPEHVAAFIRHAKAGDFNGTRFYNVRPSEWIEAGGRDFTRNDDPQDDAEDDPAIALPPAPIARARILHRRGTVTSVPLLSGDQGDRFAVLVQEERPEFDGVRTPIGELLDEPSRETADRIANRMTFGKDPVWAGRRQASAFPNTPSIPVVIRRVSIFREGVLEDGHTWDTSRVGTDLDEPAAAPADGTAPGTGSGDPDDDGR